MIEHVHKHMYVNLTTVTSMLGMFVCNDMYMFMYMWYTGSIGTMVRSAIFSAECALVTHDVIMRSLPDVSQGRTDRLN